MILAVTAAEIDIATAEPEAIYDDMFVPVPPPWVIAVSFCVDVSMLEWNVDIVPVEEDVVGFLRLLHKMDVEPEEIVFAVVDPPVFVNSLS